MGINWSLFERTLAAIKANPENWDQSDWHCGTSHCFAGLAQIIDIADKTGSVPDFNIMADADCKILGKTAWDAAKEALGVDAGQSEWLFNGERTIEDFEICIETKSVESVIDYFDLDEEGRF